MERPARPNYESNILPTDDNYENRAHRYTNIPGQKGQKGDRVSS